ncbi:transporter, major facilitator subfamily protein [Acanthamoeba castellanii str. Neff]|uniref:Transporter, major facilitator subfamily protein n=1 Tax=Acanthamoeba castellanii (strain ATCC 30010 / Neff) TaxID=1257118 RepID=L8HDF0_ACACF|nr:transporter, major facilitator subfamily protein [Acanthamoeba castellanii str. Neff]ELR23205.1 transporter, major facilitator subfamily protein [Acanthamoeba castellanii str. Neff]
MERNDEELLLPRPEVRVVQEELSVPSDVEITVDPPSDEGDEPLKAAGGESSKAQVSLPWKILVIVYGVLVGDAIASTVITPFVPDMCRTRFGIAEEQVGMASGALIGAYSLASFASSFYLGHLADKYGRKLIVLSGLMSGALGTFLFGLSPNFALAFVSRLFAGFFNANVPVTRAVCADVTEGQARILAFAYISACFSLSRSVSSGIGGAFTNIDFEGVPVFEDNRFLFPCLVGGLLNFVSFLTVLFFLPETNKGAKSADKKKGSLREGLKVVLKDWLMSKLILASCLGSFCNGGLLVAMVLFYSLAIEHHGLGFDPLRNGIAFTAFAGAGFIFQVYAFKRVLAWLGVVKMFTVSALLLCLGSVLLPSTAFIYWILGVNTTATIIVWVALTIIVCVVIATGFMCYLSTLGAMLSNACDDTRQGLTMGLNQSSSSLFRALGPFIIGIVFSVGVALDFPFFGFWILAALYLCSFLVLVRMSPLERYRVGDKAAEVLVVKEDDEAAASMEMFVIGEDDDDELHDQYDSAFIGQKIASQSNNTHNEARRNETVKEDEKVDRT